MPRPGAETLAPTDEQPEHDCSGSSRASRIESVGIWITHERMRNSNVLCVTIRRKDNRVVAEYPSRETSICPISATEVITSVISLGNNGSQSEVVGEVEVVIPTSVRRQNGD